MIEQLLARQRAALRGLDTIVARDLLTIWRATSALDPTERLEALRLVVPDLISAHGDVAATLAADFYDEARRAAGYSGWTAELADPLPAEQISKSVEWATRPIEYDSHTGKALSRLAGSARRLARAPYHNTIKQAVRRDPAKPRYARTLGHSKKGPCGFCTMLVSRGAVYAEETTDFDSHDDCKCGSMPVFNAADLPAENLELAERWQEVTRGTPDAAAARAAWDQHIRGHAA